jgi:hypothetical protein
MPISEVQQGLIVQQEFAKLLMLGSGGRIEVAAPLTDDERRDYEIHVHGQYGFGIAAQMKSVRNLRRQRGGKARYMHCMFPVRATRIVNSPYFWYFIARLDVKLMRLDDPVFLIPSTVFHKIADPQPKGAFVWYVMAANMEKRTRDKWAPYRVDPLQLGKHLLKIMNDLNKHHGQAASFLELPTDRDVLFVRRANRRRRQPRKESRSHRAAA